MLIGHEYEPQASYSLQSSFQFLQQCSRKMAMVLPFTRDLRILRQWTGRCDVSADFSPIIGHTGVDGFYITTGWGTWGVKAIPAGGEQLAQLIATGRVPELIAPFALDRFAKDQPMADLGSTGTK
jgi:sarcosine oxidase subunit beta